MGQRRVAGAVGALVAVLLPVGVLAATSIERPPAPTSQTDEQVGAGGLGVPEVTPPTPALGPAPAVGTPAAAPAVQGPPPTPSTTTPAVVSGPTASLPPGVSLPDFAPVSPNTPPPAVG